MAKPGDNRRYLEKGNDTEFSFGVIYNAFSAVWQISWGFDSSKPCSYLIL